MEMEEIKIARKEEGKVNAEKAEEKLKREEGRKGKWRSGSKGLRDWRKDKK